MTPTLITSMENTAAASGVPKSAENAALIPVIISIFLSLSLSFRMPAKVLPKLAPIWSAAPSLPTDAPNK